LFVRNPSAHAAYGALFVQPADVRLELVAPDTRVILSRDVQQTLRDPGELKAKILQAYDAVIEISHMRAKEREQAVEREQSIERGRGRGRGR
jgi:hypothetical protein